jgi:hypothetical protein
MPVGEPIDQDVVSFHVQFDEKSPLDEPVREGASRMLQSAIDAEVEAFIAHHAQRRDARVIILGAISRIWPRLRRCLVNQNP